MKTSNQNTILVSPNTNFGYKFWDKFFTYGQKHYRYEYRMIAKTPIMFEQFIEQKESDTRYELVGEYNYYTEKYGTFAYDKKELIPKLRDFEVRSKTLIMDIIQADRNFGLGCYYSGRYRPSVPLSKHINYWDTVNLIAVYIEYFEKILKKVKPAFFLSEGTGSLDSRVLHALCRMHDIPIRKLTFSRHKNYYYWAQDEYETNPRFNAGFQSISPEECDSVYIPKGYKHHHIVKQGFSLKLLPKVFKSFSWLFTQMLRRSLSWMKGKHNSKETVLLQSFWIGFYRDWILWQKIKRILENQKLDYNDSLYVYYPIHIEPESSLNVLSYEFNNQISVIDLVAKALPVGVILVVKENMLDFSTRPQGFYEWLNELPNVCLAPMEVPGSDIAQNSLATITFTGTAGLEAAAVGVPVITFSRHNIFNIMDHVFYVTDFIALREILGKLVNEPQPRDEWLQDGQRFLRAIEKESMDMGEEYIQQNQLSDKATLQLWDGLHESLELPKCEPNQI